jgi:CHAD domain-containing protein
VNTNGRWTKTLFCPGWTTLSLAVRSGQSTIELTSAYFDTADRDLQAHGLLLRRREGDDDTGWQLKVPDANGRTELHYPLSDTMPSELSALLTGVSLGKQLVNVATIHTTRKRYRITDPKSHQLDAEIADDHVCATVDGGTGEPVRWREVEVELGPAADEGPRKLAKRPASAGAKPSRYPSKLARVAAMSSTAGRPAHAGKAEEALASYIYTQIEQIFQGDVGLRRGQDPIHYTRVAIRRLRSTLRVFGKLLDRTAIEGVGDELKWFAGLIGEVRDCQVQRRRFTTALNELPPELVLGSVASRIDNELQSIERPARDRISDAMDSPRYLDILKTMRRWSTRPAIAEPVSTKALHKQARRAECKADHRLAARIAAGDDALLHRARKAAKRARDAAELVEPLDKGKGVGTRSSTTKRFRRFLATSRTASSRGRHCCSWLRKPERRPVKTDSPTACFTRTSIGRRKRHDGPCEIWPDRPDQPMARRITPAN